MNERHASCSCGQLSARTSVEPVRISMCHCLACQRRTGSAFGIQARFPSGGVAISGVSRVFVRIADSGNKVTFHFCPSCGSTIYYELEAFPDFVGIAVGAFADPSFPEPQFSAYEHCMHPWAGVPAAADRPRP